MPTYRFVLSGSAPRTKKNSPQLIPGTKHPRLVPSEAYTNWLKDVLTLKTIIHQRVPGLPISGDVQVQALVYREANTGDFLGYADAISDAIQADVWQCGACRKKTAIEGGLIRCGACGDMATLKRVRHGLGIIVDDRQIRHFDGTRLLKDSVRPRIELTITTIENQKELFPL